MTNITIYNDALHEGLWFKDLSPLLKNAELLPIKSRGENTEVINKLIEYDRPDIILCNQNIPVLVLEKTTEVPTGHNIGQRAARLVRAAELGVPSIKFLPYDARKHGLYSSMCNLNIRLLDAFLKITDIHKIPTISINWECDDSGELIRDGKQDKALSDLLDNYIGSNFNHNNSHFKQHISLMTEQLSVRLERKKSYGKPPPSVKILETNEFIKIHFSKVKLFKNKLIKHENTLIYTIDMTPDKCKRQDPYTGMQFIYDYQHCRNGILAENKHTNLILHIPQVTIEVWNKKNPNNLKTKSCLWYKIANGILLKDGMLSLR